MFLLFETRFRIFNLFYIRETFKYSRIDYLNMQTSDISLNRYWLNDLARILGILAAGQGSYTHIDKLSNAPSTELALFYIREALRDFNSFLSKNIDDKKIEKEIQEIKSLKTIEENLDKIAQLSRRELKEKASIICSKALIIAARLKMEEKA